MITNKFLDNLKNKGITPGLERIKKMSSRLSNPQNDFKSIHIAGTNGKGSVCNIIYRILKNSGYKTGLYTSPELYELNERIVINDKNIQDDYIINFIKKYRNKIKKYDLSYFETLTALTFQYFSDNNIDYAILETGMGGRFDATNIVTPETYAITSISKDHEQYLGPTLEKIVREKAGIIKSGISGVLSKQKPQIKSQLLSFAQKRNSYLKYAPELINIKVLDKQIGKQKLKISWNETILKEVSFNMISEYQLENLSTAICTLQSLENNIQKENIKKGIESVSLSGRLEIIQRSPITYFDVAHNPAAIEKVINFLNKRHKSQKINILLALRKNKDYKKIGKKLKKSKGNLFITETNSRKSLKAKKLFDYYKNYLHFDNVEKIYNFDKIVGKITESDSVWLITGTHDLAPLIEKIIN